MNIAITTPTGHIGRQVTESVLSSGAKAVLLARHPEDLQEFEQTGAQVRQASQDNATLVTRATAGVDTLFWVTPPNLTTADVRGFQKRCGQAAAEAIRANRITRVVNLSSAGAHLSKGAGPINGLHDVELLLESVTVNITHLRPGWFFENFLWQVDAIRDQSSIFLPIEGTARYPMIATKDIASAAGKLLLDESWQGHHIQGLHGPADLSLNEAAEQISRGLGRSIRYVKVSEDQTRASLRALGMSDNGIAAMLEMYRGMESGWITPAEPRSPETTTPTTMEEFAREILAPILRKEAAFAGSI